MLTPTAARAEPQPPEPVPAAPAERALASQEERGYLGRGIRRTDSADAATNVEDASAGDGSDGRLPTVYCDGGSTYAGMALHLDGGSSYGTLPRPVQDDFTLEAWIKTSTSLSGNQFWQGIGLFHADTQGGNNDFGASIINDGFAFGMGLGPGLEDVMMQSTSAVTTGEWMTWQSPGRRAPARSDSSSMETWKARRPTRR